MDVRLPDGTVIRGIPEGTSKAEIMDKLSAKGYDTTQLNHPSQSSDQPQHYQYGAVQDEIDPDTLSQDKDWLQASRTLYKMNNGEDWKGSEQDLAEYGLDLMGWFNYNLPAMAVNAQRVREADQNQKEAFLYLMDSYDNLDMSWGGVGRFFKGALSDPTTYVGLGTLGIGTAAAQGGKAATKEGLKALLKQGLRAGTVAAVEGGMYAGVDNTARQSIEVAAGRKEEIDGRETLESVGLGSAIGLVGGTALDATANGIGNAVRRARSSSALPATNARDTSPAPEVAEGAQPQVGEELSNRPSLESPEAQGTTPPLNEAPRENPPDEEPEDLSEGAASGAQESTDETNLPMDPLRELETIDTHEADDLFEYTSLDDLSIPDRDTSIPYERQRMTESIQRGLNLANEFRNLHFTQIEDIADDLRTRQMTRAEWEDTHMSVRMATSVVARELEHVMTHLNKGGDTDTIAKLSRRATELQDRLGALRPLDEAFGSHAGYDLRLRQEGLNLRRLPDPQEDPEGFLRHMYNASQEQDMQRLRRDYDFRIEKAHQDNDTGEVIRLTTLKNLELDSRLAEKLNTEPSMISKLNELAISNAFTLKTVQINMIPSGLKVLGRPLLDTMLSNPFEASARRQMFSTYGAMASGIKAAYRASLAAFRYEQAILTRESGRLMEGELAIRGQKGALIRTIPRLLNATDEFLSQLAYRGFVAGDASARAFEEGTAQGLKGKALDDFVKGKVSKEVSDAFSNSASDEAIRMVANKGINLGYTGDKLANYVKRELMRNPDALRHGNNKEAIDYVRDALYKRAFSGTNQMSKLAQNYERLINDVPVIRLLWQLFFRTPVRVFEEGVRMTPGLQVIVPRFLSDLRGKNGPRSQVRAQGEALMSMALTAEVINLYAQGRITGDGAYDNWRQQQARSNSDLPEPYTIKFDDGSTWNYKNFDPLATPVKIMVNALERYGAFAMRERQGEFKDKDLTHKALAAVAVPMGAVAAAIRDANLMAGVDGALELGENLADPEQREGAGIRFLGEKLRLVVPNTLQKIAASNDTTIQDPATFWQMLESKVLEGATLGEYNSSTAKSYDILGNPRKLPNPGVYWYVFETVSEEQRRKDLPEDQLEVMRKLDELSRQTGATFAPPTTHAGLDGMDLRTQMTKDGKETLYDRWQKHYRDLHPEKALLPILESNAPTGTKQERAAKVQAVQQVISRLRNAAFYQLMGEESGVSQQFIQRLLRSSEIQSGRWDSTR